MDNGQARQIDENPPFFTEGVGNQSVEYANIPDDNPSLSDDTIETVPSRSQNQNFGRNAINGQIVERPEEVNFEAYAPEKAPDFGPAPEMLQIEEIDSVSNIPTEKANDYDETVIRVDGDSLNPQAIGVMDDMEKKLNKTEDAAAFVDDFNRAKVALQKNNAWGHLEGAA